MRASTRRIDKTRAYRKIWSAGQKILRRLLTDERDYQQALPVLLGQHETMHTAGLRPGLAWSFQDEVLRGLTFDQMREVPKGQPHSIAWIIWHMSRIEDVTVNLLLNGSRQVLSSRDWPAKLETTSVGVGNEMSPEELELFSDTINLKALLAYRLAVGKRTRSVLIRLRPQQLWQRPAPERLKRVAEEGAVGEKAFWLLKYWGGHPGANLLLMPATRHSFVHFSEIRLMLTKLEQPVLK